MSLSQWQRRPRGPAVPAVGIGWLGRHSDYTGRGLGVTLLFDAIKTVATAPIAAHAVFAGAIDDQAAALFAALGYTALVWQPRMLYFPVATALNLMSP